jgi:hypothetical protein
LLGLPAARHRHRGRHRAGQRPAERAAHDAALGPAGERALPPDGSAATIRDAIKRHGNQAAASRKAFDGLAWHLQQSLVEFLEAI